MKRQRKAWNNPVSGKEPKYFFRPKAKINALKLFLASLKLGMQCIKLPFTQNIFFLNPRLATVVATTVLYLLFALHIYAYYYSPSSQLQTLPRCDKQLDCPHVKNKLWQELCKMIIIVVLHKLEQISFARRL